MRMGCDWGAVGVLVPRYTLPLGGDPNPYATTLARTPA